MPKRHKYEAAVRRGVPREKIPRQFKKTRAHQFAEKFKVDPKNRRVIFLLMQKPAKTAINTVAKFLGMQPVKINRIEHVITIADSITSLEAARRLDLPFTPQVSLVIKELMQVKPEESQKLLADFKRFAIQEAKKLAVNRTKASQKKKRK